MVTKISYLHQQLTTKKAIIMSKANKAKLEKIIMERLEKAQLSSLQNQKLIKLILESVAKRYKKQPISHKLLLSSSKGSDLEIQHAFDQLVIEAIDEAIVDFQLQKKFPDKPQITQLIKQECSLGDHFYVKNRLALLLAERIDESMSLSEIEDLIDDSLYADDSDTLGSKELGLTESSKTLRSAQQMSVKITKQVLLKNKLQTNYFLQRSKMLHQHMSLKAKNNIESEEKEEKFEQITEFSAETSEIIKLAGELSEKSHHIHTMSHAAESASKALIQTGGIGTFIAGLLGAVSLPVLCIIEKRKPSLAEVGMIGLSAITIILGALAIASVGGPVGVGIFALTAAVLGLGKTFLNYFKDFGERHHLTKKVKKIANKQESTELELSNIKTCMDKLCKELEEKLNYPPNKTAHEAIQHLHKKINALNIKAYKLTKKLTQLNKDYAKASVKLIQLNKRHTNTWHHAKTGIYVVSGLLAISGAALMLIPVMAPLAITLMIVASTLTLTTLTASFIAGRVKKHQAKKAQQKAALTKALSSDPMAPTLQLSSSPMSTSYKRLGTTLNYHARPKATKKLPKLRLKLQKEADNEEYTEEVTYERTYRR
jgi:hypothetical protein